MQDPLHSNSLVYTLHALNVTSNKYAATPLLASRYTSNSPNK